MKRNNAAPLCSCAPLDSFGVDAVDRRFTQEEVEEVVAFVNQLAV